MHYNYYGNVQIDDVTSFKYLGFIISNTGDRSLGIEDLVTSTRKACYSLLKHARSLGGLPVSVMCQLFSMLVEPVMLYASEIWGSSPNLQPMEKILLDFCKHNYIACSTLVCHSHSAR